MGRLHEFPTLEIAQQNWNTLESDSPFEMGRVFMAFCRAYPNETFKLQGRDNNGSLLEIGIYSPDTSPTITINSPELKAAIKREDEERALARWRTVTT